LEYLKKLKLPNGGRLALTASASYVDRQVRPDFGMQLEFGGETETPDGSARAVWVGNTFDLRQRFNVVRGLGLEVSTILALCSGALPTCLNEEPNETLSS
jgi:hypothetical protein